ncbi:unnamed protein product [Cercopithifilaria johnstoni]|uniref:LIM zinc-binding domain-containing protein n=1 Tax=Cercopithifilaria johnstoni TaxID=2874296 RepID=A0A8J2M4G1_9BILA|nr:unnamed protein product [Cercopithifilaria johnstoni]
MLESSKFHVYLKVLISGGNSRNSSSSNSNNTNNTDSGSGGGGGGSGGGGGGGGGGNNNTNHSGFSSSSSGKEIPTTSAAVTATPGIGYSSCIMYDQHPSVADSYSLVVTTSADTNNTNNGGVTIGKIDNDIETTMISRSEGQRQQEHGCRLCIACLQEIRDPFVLRVNPDLEFHAGCLKCEQCECYLDETCTAYIRDNKPYCKKDYIRLVTFDISLLS